MRKIKPLEEDGSVQSWAACEATKILATHWNDCLQDGYELGELLVDVAMVVFNLKCWLNDILEETENETTD